MAVTPNRIEERFKVLFSSVNLSKERLNEISARLAKKPKDDATDADIDAVLNEANDFVPFASIAKDDDRLRTAEQKIKDLAEKSKTPEQIEAERIAKEKAEAEAKAQEDAMKEAPEWAKAFMKQTEDKINSISSTVENYKTSNETSSKMTKAEQLFKESDSLKNLDENLFQSWLKRVDTTSEVSIEEQVKALDVEHATLVQANADNKNLAGDPPQGFSNTGPTDEQLGDLVNEL